MGAMIIQHTQLTVYVDNKARGSNATVSDIRLQLCLLCGTLRNLNQTSA